jgi:hypothetical protein
MRISPRLYKGIVYIPTGHRVEGRGFHVTKAPVGSAPVEQTEKLRETILAALARGNPPTSLDEARATLSDSRNSAILKATHAKSWYALDRQTKGLWSVREEDGLYEIRVDQPMETHGWHEDETKRIRFPAGTAVEEVIDRLIAMIQECARQQD